MFREVDPKMNLSELEEGVLSFWDEANIFQKSLEKTLECPKYTFYDGPPFATGTPHYGHIVASTMKDVVPRYWTMRGYYVERKWGWDCHGLPIENIAEKELGITHKKQIEEIGVEKFNDVCRSKVLEYVSEWEKVIRRLGRWADMKNAYKTMDLSFMESVWWVFKQLWDKGLIYENYRSMHICPRCETTLSQSEVTEGYKMVKDLSVIARFELVDEPNTFVLAWTTTPWTLIGNVALAVGRDIEYSKVRVSDAETGKVEDYILASELVQDVFKDRPYEFILEMKGVDLLGRRYQPLFDYYSKDESLPNRENGWQIVDGAFVTTEEGAGIVHIAPAFGEDDMNLGREKNLPFIQHVGMDGVIKPEAGEFAGMHVKDIEDPQKVDIEIIKYLAAHGLLFSKEKYEHSYPHCWRCDTPLLNYATSSWFVNITNIKEDALRLAKEINWSPAHIKEGRFGNWLEGARDWSISRQRYWASVIPIWKCDCGEMRVFGSIVELEQASGATIIDLHKDVIDMIEVKCDKCQGAMKRIPDVLDCWFESGSMPYAQLHYPFENEEKFTKSFPAEFIAEGVDQTRAWFYYLHVLSTALKNSVAFQNVIVNGIVLAEDGKKMSKKLKNYPDPTEMFNKYGADVMRLYLMSSPVVAAENVNFSEKEMAELSRGLFRMLWNSYSFFVLYANIDHWSFSSVIPAEAGIQDSPHGSRTHSTVAQGRFSSSQSGMTAGGGNILDRWILSELNILTEKVNQNMERYDLVRTARLFPEFIDNLSNWYIRRSRKRFWKSENDTDKNEAYQTLWTVLVELSKLMAPFTPFLAEDIYKNLTGEESVHLAGYPQVNAELIDRTLNDEMRETRKLVEFGLSKRAEAKIKVRQPLQSATYFGKKIDTELESIVADELNVKEVVFGGEGDLRVELNTEITEELKLEGLAREIIRTIQNLRKDSGFKVDDRIVVYYQTESSDLRAALTQMKDLIARETLANEILDTTGDIEGDIQTTIEGSQIWVGIKRK